MNLQFTKEDQIGILAVEGRLDAANADNLKNRFQTFLKETNYIIADCASLEFVDSTGLGALVACLKYASEAGGDLIIANLHSKPRMTFELTRAFRIFDIYDDLNAAREAVSEELS